MLFTNAINAHPFSLFRDENDYESFGDPLYSPSKRRKKRFYHQMQEEIDDELEEQCRLLKKKNAKKGPRPGGSNKKGRKDYWKSVWGVMLQEPGLQVPGSEERRAFQRRFRVPYSIFTQIVTWTKTWHEKSS